MPHPYANTRISKGLAKSRAEGVTIVLGPINIFRFSRIAARTSASQTNATTSGDACTGAGCGGDDCGADEDAVPAPGFVSQLKPVFALVLEDTPRRERNRSTTSVATFGTAPCETGAVVVMPRAAR